MKIGNAAARLSARAKGVLLCGVVALAAGCTTVGPDPRDPNESFNRAVYAFNEGFDRAITKPVATAYHDVIPRPVQGWVRNFFANIADIFIGVNNMLQGKPMNDWARFAINTVIGIGGINDVASDMGLEKHNEDFGQTLGRWGEAPGAYFVWPILGSSDMRDTVGLVFDLGLDPVDRHNPVRVRNTLIALRATSQRAELLDASRILEEAALDKYAFQRDAYLQRRRYLIYDGHPPKEDTSARKPAAPRAAADGPQHSDAAAQYAPKVPDNYEAVLAAEMERKDASKH